MVDITEEKILKLQKNLPIIRNLAGWTAEALGERIGVSRQTITSIEKSEKLAMSKTQYIAIRAVLDYEIEMSGNETLANAISVLVDADDLLPEQKEKIQKTVDSINSEKIRRVNDKFVFERMVTLFGALGAVGLVVASAALSKTGSKWLSDLMAQTAEGDKK